MGRAGIAPRGLALCLLCAPELPGVWEAQPVMEVWGTRACEAAAAKMGR